jgi:hypothetical protein
MTEEEKDDLEYTEEETTSEELEPQEQTDEEAAEGEPQTPKTPPSDDPSIPLSVLRKYATEYGLEEQDFAKIDDPEASVRRAMQQMKGFRELASRLEKASEGAMPPTFPQTVPPDGAPDVTPAADDTAVDELLADPNAYIERRVADREAKRAEQARKMEMFQQNQAITQWMTTVDQNELAQLTPHMMNDRVIALKRNTGQVITADDVRASYENARTLVSLNATKVRQDGFEDGAAAAEAKRRAGLETGKRRSGAPPVASLDELQKRFNAGEELTDAEINAAIAAEEGR